MITRTNIIKAIDETIDEISSDGWIQDKYPLPMCERSSFLFCNNCPANLDDIDKDCSGWESQDEELLYFCFVKAMFESGDL